MQINPGNAALISLSLAGLCLYIAFYSLAIYRKNGVLKALPSLIWIALCTVAAAVMRALEVTSTESAVSQALHQARNAFAVAGFIPLLWFITRQGQLRLGKVLRIFTVVLAVLVAALAAAAAYCTLTGHIPIEEMYSAPLRSAGLPDMVLHASAIAALFYALYLTYIRPGTPVPDRPWGLRRTVLMLAACELNDIGVMAGINPFPELMPFGMTAAVMFFAHYFIRDIERIAAIRGALQESEKMFRSYFELGLVGSVITTPERGFVKINQRICDMLGYTMEEVREFTWDKITHPGDMGPKNTEFLRMLTGELDGYTAHRRYIRKDGSILHAEIGVRAVRNDDGSLRYAIVHAQDVGDLVRAGEALQKKNEELEATNEELSATVEELIATNEEFEAQNEELIKVQMEVTKSEERFRSLIQNLSDIITIHDENGAIIFESPSASRLFGFAPGHLLGKTPDQFIHPDDLPAVVLDLTEVYENKNDLLPTHFRFLKADGGYANLESIGKNMLDNPSIRGVVITSRDVSERVNALEIIQKKNEELVATNEELVATNEEFEAQNNELLDTQQDLAKSEGRFRSLIQNLTEVITVHDPDGTIVYASPSAARVLGFEPGEMIGRSPIDFLHPDELDFALKELLAVYEKTNPGIPTEFRFRCRDGSYKYIEAVGVNLLNDPAVKGVVITSRDISERKRSMEALRDSETRYRTLIETTGEGYWHIDTEFRTVNVNQALCEMLGYAREEIIGKSPFEFVDRENLRVLEEQFARIPLVSHRNYDIVLKHRSGRDVFTHFSGTTLFGRDGSPSGSFGLVTNTTERMLAEMERERLHRHMLQVQRIEAVGTLAGGIAHDFNNLLTVINGNAQMLLRQIAPDTPMRAEVSEILNAGERAANLTRQLLAFSRRQFVEVRVIDLNAMITELRKLYSRLIEEDITIVTDLCPERLLVKADPVQIEQVTLNLLINARDAINDLEGESLEKAITVTTGTAHFTADPAPGGAELTPGTYAYLRIRDTGVGMSDDVKARIFEPFFTTKDVGKGTGLGLSTVYGNLKQNGGTIRVESEPMKGTTFTVYLPLADEEFIMTDTHCAEESTRRGSERILFVEDDEGVRSFALRALEGGGYRVVSAGDGLEALKILEEDAVPFDLVVTDIVMPNMSGSELIQRVEELRPGMKYIFATGYPDKFISVPELHASAYIQKPYTVQTLLSRIREVLDAQ